MSELDEGVPEQRHHSMPRPAARTMTVTTPPKRMIFTALAA
jgi:hypothetical protein